MFKTGPLYLANREATEDIVINQGGQFSGKTIGILQTFLDFAISQPNRILTVTAESVPHIDRGVLRNTHQIIAGSPELQSKIVDFNATKRFFTFASGSILEFPVFPDVLSAHGPKRDYLFVNELPTMSWEVFEQLMERTSVRVFADYNPSYAFWCHEKLLATRRVGNKTVKLLISDHRHNPFLTQQQHDHIEEKAKKNPEWGRVYARGLTGKIEGAVFQNWEVIPGVPEEAKLVGRGLDFGFTNDPTALVAVYLHEDALVADEEIRDTGLTNPDIANRAKAEGVSHKDEVIADSSSPKCIAELNRLGMYVIPAVKGPDSILAGIDILKRYHIKVTARSTGLRKELFAYKWRPSRDGHSKNIPEDAMNHSIDALRYVALMKLSETNKPTAPAGTRVSRNSRGR